MDEVRAAVELANDEHVWRVDESPGSVVASIESARQQGKKFVELTDDRQLDSRVWFSIDSITAIYDWREAEQEREPE